MFWFNHPKQVGDGKALAVLTQHERSSAAVQQAAQEAGQQAAQEAAFVAGLPTPHAGRRFEPVALQFPVRYTLSEYVSFMWQHSGYLIRRRRIGLLATLWMQLKSTAMAALHFVAQGRSRRTYEFTIDAHGIVRASRAGVTLIPWDEVRTIRTYARGYMLVLARGTLPIPYRCLGGAESTAMDGYASAHRALA